jgi:putative transposase
MTAEEIQEFLAEVVARRGAPPYRIRGDIGPEFAAEAVRSYLEASGSGTLYVAPASPWQNGYDESFHGTLRDEFLELEEFEGVAQAQALAELWKEEYNTERPHSSSEYQTPAEFAATFRRYVPIEKTRLMRHLLDKRTVDSRYGRTKKWGAGHSKSPGPQVS